MRVSAIFWVDTTMSANSNHNGSNMKRPTMLEKAVDNLVAYKTKEEETELEEEKQQKKDIEQQDEHFEDGWHDGDVPHGRNP